MGEVEKEARKRKQRRNIQQAILATVGLVGVLAVGAIAPNLMQVLPHITGDRYKLAYKAKTAAGRLAQKGLVRFTMNHGIRSVELTEKGRRALTIEQASYSIDTRYRRWDKRYRLVMFDVPQRRRSARDKLRSVMRECGFLRLQDSVWVYPHDCEELIALIKVELHIGKEMLYAVVESLENDAWVKRHFGIRG